MKFKPMDPSKTGALVSLVNAYKCDIKTFEMGGIGRIYHFSPAKFVRPNHGLTLSQPEVFHSMYLEGVKMLGGCPVQVTKGNLRPQEAFRHKKHIINAFEVYSKANDLVKFQPFILMFDEEVELRLRLDFKITQKRLPPEGTLGPFFDNGFRKTELYLKTSAEKFGPKIEKVQNVGELLFDRCTIKHIQDVGGKGLLVLVEGVISEEEQDFMRERMGRGFLHFIEAPPADNTSIVMIPDPNGTIAGTVTALQSMQPHNR